MKQELPIAVALLALGCMLWLWQTNAGNIANAARQAAPAVASKVTQSVPAKVASSSAKFNVDKSADELLLQVAQEFESGPSRQGDLELECRFGGAAFQFQGRFWEQGFDSKKARIELITGQSQGKVTHVCDGRFLYKLTEHHRDRKLSFIDLQQLNTEDARIILATLPASWVGTGSIGTTLRSLSEAFEMRRVQANGEAGSALSLEGTWNPNHLAKLMLNHVDHREIIPSPNWSKVPDQFPHGVRIQVATVNGALQPLAIQFFRFTGENSDRDEIQSMLSIKFGPIQQRQFTKSLFQMDSIATDAVDETQVYRERIELLAGKNRVAEELGTEIR